LFDQRRGTNKSHPIGRLSEMHPMTFYPLMNNARTYACKHYGFRKRYERDLLRTHWTARKRRARSRTSDEHDFMLLDRRSGGASPFHVGYKRGARY